MEVDSIARDMEGLEVKDQVYRIADSPDVGRHIVTTTAIPQGAIILHDKPLVTGPSRDSVPVCLGCYRSIDLQNKYSSEDEATLPHTLCPRCKWPLCGEECSNSPRHKPECYFLFQSGCRVNACDTDSLYDVIMVLRCLYLRDTDQEAWVSLCSLQSCDPSSMDDELVDRAKKVANLICGTFKLGDKFSRELVFEMCGRLETNSFEIPLGLSSVSVQGVYSKGCMVEHCCTPSVHRTFNSDLSLTIRAAYPLEEGDAVSLCYTDSLWTTAQRREHLVYSKDFICNCDRCQDRTENETYLSALKCLKCPDGYYLPDSPLDCSSPWSCSQCKLVAPQGYSELADSKVSAAVSKIEEEGLTVPACKKFLATYSKVLHPHHAHMLDVKYSLLNLLGHTDHSSLENLTEEDLKLKEELAKTFLEIARKLLPGISRLKGTSLYELFLTVKQRAVLALAQLHEIDHSKENILGLLGAASLHLQDCIDCLQYEPEHRPEGQVYQRALQDRELVLNLIQQTELKFKS
ncbi:protein msta [Eurytemora carolleeae]|uniref:protein msta n=1 Tax=Eurytemora carolleeae TaxID=1294199 RepID=UPI000C75D1E6|nr:protein msta [Eurytemora carolleeae]XP_023337000.1 protein msta [Eurytemora carolleeae]|eukprot:XP_023336991.1 protein msta-like [Eurytemora affinis]